jgi:L-fucose mutarotase/ribose pyranase (RbsD/FucU family)
MAIEDQNKAISDLGKLGEDIPGLNVDTVLDNLVQKNEALKSQFENLNKVKEENLERGMTEDEAAAKVEEDKKKAIEDAKKNLKPMVEEEIIKMKQEYKTAKEALASIPTEAQAAMALVVLPPAISVPPSTANPAYTLGVALQTKKSLLKTLNIVLSSLTTLMMLANKLKFELPAPILKLVETLSIVTKGLSIIPG